MTHRLIWVDNLRALACLMVILIHTTTYYVTTGVSVGNLNWDIANLLNSLSRVSVPLFFMISGYLFFGEKSAGKKHLLRIGCCLLFYSAVSLLYIALFTRIGFWPSLRNLLFKPVFYHLWFFYAIAVIYLLSPLIQVKPVAARTALVIGVVLGILVNPQMAQISWHQFHLIPVNLFVAGDTFYYVLYALLGRAIGMMDTQRRGVTMLAGLLFAAAVGLIAVSTKKQMFINGAFADTYYVYCGPLVFIAAIALFVWGKNSLATAMLPGMRRIADHSLAIYGFHALIINLIRSQKWDVIRWPLLDMVYVFAVALGVSLLLGYAVRRLDPRRLVS
ncbi:O-acetyltransferase [Chimaeribacter arupi]|uniref:O-acetyltransferase WecH n=1 Tax=Chimaeribacter arupi TaxID=2060066 RepID=A0A2N5ELD5_9GAMM|nr:acyltransferase [Chimaeribacter arupi]PLR37165.1 O-acetyltransferase [Chimaeribacter arupi]PLR45536.1 O-acetyltransferase [Chimaeribacter arupi]PLR47990.1 O-acetyltransferase [Chimaeribacter arupi]